MHLRLTESELATLVEMVSLATQSATWNQLPEHEADFQRFVAMEQKILSRATETGCGDWIAYDQEEQRLFLTEEAREQLYAQKCVDEMRSELFWEELIFRLAERDTENQIGKAKWTALNDKQRDKLIAPLQDRYFAEFRKNGIRGLHLIYEREQG